jgi:hypothetical protein
MTQRYITEAAWAALQTGSFEARTAQLEAAAGARLGGPVRIVATFADHAVAVGADERFHRVAYGLDAGGGVVVTEVAAHAVPTLAEAEVPAHVAALAHALVRDVAMGALASDAVGTRVTALARLVEADTGYWAADACVALLERCGADTPWARWYGGATAAIREGVWGSVREREARIPAPLAEGSDAPAVRAGCTALSTALAEIIDEARGLVFDQTQQTLDAIRASLIGEAQAMVVALERAGRLMTETSRDTRRVTTAHGACARQARIMTIATGFLRTQARGPNDGGTTP